jgi:hypothetical protein
LSMVTMWLCPAARYAGRFPEFQIGHSLVVHVTRRIRTA